MPDLETITKVANTIGVTGVLALFIWGLMKGWFVTGSMYAAIQQQVTALQQQITLNQTEMQQLRKRDADQQDELGRLRKFIDDQQSQIVGLRKDLADEKVLKEQALVKVNALTQENVGLKSRIAELEKTVGAMNEKGALRA